MGESLLLGRSCRRETSLCLHANSPALAVTVKQMIPVSAIKLGSKCHNSLTCEQSANQHGCCMQALHVAGGRLDVGRSMAVMWSIPLGSPGLGNAIYLRTRLSSVACL